MAVSAVIGGAVIGAGATAYAGSKSASATKSAASTASAAELEQYYQTRDDLEPWREAGKNALGNLADASGMNGAAGNANALAAFQTSPGYQFQVDQGQRQLGATAAARGMSLSGAALKESAAYTQGLAAQQYDTYANRLAALANVGQTATNTTAAAGANAANGVGQAAMQAGNAQAASYQQTGAAINNGLNNAAYAYGRYSGPAQPSAAGPGSQGDPNLYNTSFL